MSKPNNPTLTDGVLSPVLVPASQTKNGLRNPLIQLSTIIELYALHDSGKYAFYRKLQRQVLREARRSLNADSQAILRALNEGYSTRKELAQVTGLPETTVHCILHRLLRQKLVIRRLIRGEPGKGGDRRSFLWWPAE